MDNDSPEPGTSPGSIPRPQFRLRLRDWGGASNCQASWCRTKPYKANAIPNVTRIEATI